MSEPTLRDDTQVILRNWANNYRYQGGLRSIIEGSVQSLRLRRSQVQLPQMADSQLDCMTFSVLPALSAMWATQLHEILSSAAITHRMLIGDCSGGLARVNLPAGAFRVPVLNYHHGVKLDLFMKHLCRAPYVLVCDDDLFLLGPGALEWALAEFRRDPNIAVISLYPRQEVSDPLKEELKEAMGSFCLLIRRDIWQAERLSFQSNYEPYSQGYIWFYDTADYANVELVRRGYDVVIAPPDIRAQLVTLEGVSTWGLKIQKYKGNIHDNVAGITVRQEKAYRTVLFLKAIREQNLLLGQKPIMSEQLLSRAEAVIVSLLDPDTLHALQDEVRLTLVQLQKAGYFSAHAHSSTP